jgi:hypothetical protein
MTNTTTTTKFTKKMDFTAIIEVINTARENEIVDEVIANRLINRMESEIALLAKKNSAERKPTKTQIANDGLRKQILDFMEIGKAYTASEIQKALGVEQYTLPKVTAVLRPMLTVTAKEEVNPDGVIERFMEKGVAYFRKLDIETAEDEY